MRYKISWIIPCLCSSLAAVSLAFNSNHRYRMPHGIEVRYYQGLGGTWYKKHVTHCVVCDSLGDVDFEKDLVECPPPIEVDLLGDVWW